MPRAFLLELPAYLDARGSKGIAEDRRLANHPGVADDFSLKTGATWQQVAKDCGAKNVLSFQTRTGQIQRAAWRYLSEPDYQQKARARLAKDPKAGYGYMIGVRLLADAGIHSWEDFEASVASGNGKGHEAGAWAVKRPEPETPAVEATVTPIRAPGGLPAKGALRALYREILDAWAAQAVKIEELEAGIEAAEQAKRSLMGTNTALAEENAELEALLDELTKETDEVRGAVAGGPVALPVRPVLTAAESKKGVPMPFEYSDVFKKRFAALKEHEKRQVVKTLERIQYRTSKKLKPGEFNVPEGTLSCRAAMKYRLFWRAVGGKIKLYDIVPKHEFSERRHR